MIRYNLRGRRQAEEETRKEQKPYDIAVLQGKLVYTDPNSRCIDIIERGTLESNGRRVFTNISLKGWIPQGVCSTRSGGLLVIMKKEDETRTKVVLYTYIGNREMKEKKSIPTDDQIQHLYSSGSYKYLAENRNDDICVADCYGNEVVVVSTNGNLRFRYTGHFSKDMGEFTPRAISTDSQANILTTDWVNHCVHIIDRDGHILRFIDNCGLQSPYGLCVDSTDNLFVADWRTGRVKKIQYYM